MMFNSSSELYYLLALSNYTIRQLFQITLFSSSTELLYYLLLLLKNF